MEEVAAREQTGGALKAGTRRRPFLLRYVRPRTGVALALWRVEAYTATPLALLLIATLGRWPGALVMGTVMAAYSALFLYLLEDDPALDEMRAWAGRRRAPAFSAPSVCSRAATSSTSLYSTPEGTRRGARTRRRRAAMCCA